MECSNKIQFIVEPVVYLMIALSLLVLYWQWIVAWMVASCFHELCHYAAIRFCGSKVTEIRIGLNGTQMVTQFYNTEREIACALAGPVGSALLLLLSHFCPYVSLCAGVQLLFNMLPIYPMDGGRVLKGMLELFLPISKVKQIVTVIHYIVMGMLTAITVCGTLQYNIGVIPLLAVSMLWLRIKKPCKERRIGVQ